jgi:hypothetical protein
MTTPCSFSDEVEQAPFAAGSGAGVHHERSLTYNVPGQMSQIDIFPDWTVSGAGRRVSCDRNIGPRFAQRADLSLSIITLAAGPQGLIDGLGHRD